MAEGYIEHLCYNFLTFFYYHLVENCVSVALTINVTFQTFHRTQCLQECIEDMRH